jgi:hypothetical protein
LEALPWHRINSNSGSFVGRSRQGHPRRRRELGTIEKRFESIQTRRPRTTARVPRDAVPDRGRGRVRSGVILYDETIRQKAADGTPLVKVLASKGIMPGIKVDAGRSRSRLARRRRSPRARRAGGAARGVPRLGAGSRSGAR